MKISSNFLLVQGQIGLYCLYFPLMHPQVQLRQVTKPSQIEVSSDKSLFRGMHSILILGLQKTMSWCLGHFNRQPGTSFRFIFIV